MDPPAPREPEGEPSRQLRALTVDNLQLRQAAQEANRLTEDLLATLSHELRDPLSAILGWTRVLRSVEPDADTTRRALESIERSVRAQTQLIDDLVDISRIVAGRLRLDVRLVELEPLIAAAVETVRPAAEAKAIQLDTFLDSGIGPVSGDPERLEQIVFILVSNAVKLTPASGRVQVRLERRGAGAEIVVSDTRPGATPELLSRAFDGFRLAGAAAPRSPGGLGLSLAIARHLTELHGGAIHAETAGRGSGATFTVSFPAGPPGGPSQAPPGTSRSGRPTC
jgi:signal transduction histidine kinase